MYNLPSGERSLARAVRDLCQPGETHVRLTGEPWGGQSGEATSVPFCVSDPYTPRRPHPLPQPFPTHAACLKLSSRILVVYLFPSSPHLLHPLHTSLLPEFRYTRSITSFACLPACQSNSSSKPRCHCLCVCVWLRPKSVATSWSANQTAASGCIDFRRTTRVLTTATPSFSPSPSPSTHSPASVDTLNLRTSIYAIQHLSTSRLHCRQCVLL